MQEKIVFFIAIFGKSYIVPERKSGFSVKVKDIENFNRRNIWRILRIKVDGFGSRLYRSV